tara:strand:+ start:6662 stop:6808 length:147 start_codon:yes stop_codon:yes gene_type:complete
MKPKLERKFNIELLYFNLIRDFYTTEDLKKIRAFIDETIEEREDGQII